MTGTEPLDAQLARVPVLAVNAADLAVSAATCVASSAVFWAGARGVLSLEAAGVLHLAVLCVPALFLGVRQRRRGELTIPMLLLVATLAGGPVGAAGTAFTALALWCRRPTPQRLEDWYDYIAGVVARSRLT
jgi:hypothetical protein